MSVRPPTTVDLPLQYRGASFQASPGLPDGELDVVWTTGAGVERYDYSTGQRYLETLSLSPECVRLDALNSGAPLLDTHRLNSSADVMGHVVPGSVALSPTDGKARVSFDMNDPAAVKMYGKAKSGHLRGVSVGYEVHRYEVTPATDGGIETRSAVDWTPRELSGCPVGADPNAGFRTAALTTPCTLSYRTQPTPIKTGSKMLKRVEAPTPEMIASIVALIDSIPMKTPNDKELFAYKVAALVASGGASSVTDPAAEDAGAAGGTMAEDAGIADAAREVTGLKVAAEVKRALYSLSLKADRVGAVSTESQKRTLSLRKITLDKAQASMLITPAKRALVESWLNAGTYSDEQLAADLGVAVPVVNNEIIEPPATTTESAQRNAPRTAEQLVAEPAFVAFAKRNNYDAKEALLTARSYIKTNGNAPFEAPTARFS